MNARYLEVAAAAVMAQVSAWPGLAVPVDPAVAQFMGLAEDHAADPADYGEDGMMIVAEG